MAEKFLPKWTAPDPVDNSRLLLRKPFPRNDFKCVGRTDPISFADRLAVFAWNDVVLQDILRLITAIVNHLRCSTPPHDQTKRGSRWDPLFCLVVMGGIDGGHPWPPPFGRTACVQNRSRRFCEPPSSLNPTSWPNKKRAPMGPSFCLWW